MNRIIRKGVIPAAGSAQRLGYLSHLLPKTLFPIYDRPIFHHLINQMESIGIEDIYVIVNVHKEKIIEYYKSIRSDLKSRIQSGEFPPHSKLPEVLESGAKNFAMVSPVCSAEKPAKIIRKIIDIYNRYPH